MTDASTAPPRRASLFPFVVAAAALVVTQALFVLGDRWAPSGTRFDGLTGMVDDQNMYYSFIRQAAEGNWLFVNRLTHVEHRPALFNLEWLALGWLSRVFPGRDTAVYLLWRAIGIGLLIGGCWSLAGVTLRDPFQRRLALLLCAFGGGFGWLVLLLERAGLNSPHPIAMLDISDAMYPFSHILFNPHLAVSHGLTLFSLAAFVMGERTRLARWYVAAGVIAALNGLIRPYDMLVLVGAVPLFAALSLLKKVSGTLRTRENPSESGCSQSSRHFFQRPTVQLRYPTALRFLPLLIVAPVIAYYAALFQLHPVFKFWASQGTNTVKPLALGWHLFNLGPAAALCLARLCLVRRRPLSSAELWLAAWIAAMLLLYHAHKLPGFGFMPYTPLVGATLPSTMFILGAGVFSLDRGGTRPFSRLLVASLIVLTCLGSVVWVVKIGRNLAYLPEHYVPTAVRDADNWLAAHAGKDDVILSTLPAGNRMARYVPARFVLGHINITPHVKELSPRVERFYRGELGDAEAQSLLDELGVRWVYVGPHERALGSASKLQLPGLVEEYANPDVQVYARERQ
ncbi:MAG: hypothetical protein ACT4QC_10360 [Planctomycetaceae bacterium]